MFPPPAKARLGARPRRGDEAWEVGQPWVARQLVNLAFGLVLAALLVAPLTPSRFDQYAQGLILGLVSLAALLWVASLCLGRETHVVFSIMNAPVLVLTTYAIVRYSIADVESVARPHLMAVLTVSLVFFLVLNTLRRRWQLLALVHLVVGLGLVLALHGFWQILRGGVATANFAQPGALAVYLHLAFAVAAASFLFSRHSLNQKVVFAFGALACVIGLALTQAHWSWLGWGAASVLLGIYLLRKRGWKFRWVLTGAATLLMVLAAALIVVSRLELTSPASLPLGASLTEPAPGMGTRILDLLRLAQGNLPTGVGPGMSAWLLPNGAGAAAPLAGPEFLVFFAEYGALGVILLLWAIVCFGILALRILALRADRYSAATPSNRYAFGVAGLAMFVAVVFDAGSIVGLHAPANLLTCAALAAATLTCGLHHRGSLEDKPPKLGQYSVVRVKGIARYVLILGVLALLGLLLYRSYKAYPANLLAQLGERKQAHLRWGQAESFYRRAWMLDSRNFAIAEGCADLFAARATWNRLQSESLAHEAIRWYDRALTLNPYNFDALIKKARLYDLLGQQLKAREYFTQAVAARPTRGSYLTELGLHHYRWNDLATARNAFERALQRDPSDERARQQLHAFLQPAAATAPDGSAPDPTTKPTTAPAPTAPATDNLNPPAVAPPTEDEIKRVPGPAV